MLLNDGVPAFPSHSKTTIFVVTMPTPAALNRCRQASCCLDHANMSFRAGQNDLASSKAGEGFCKSLVSHGGKMNLLEDGTTCRNVGDRS